MFQKLKELLGLDPIKNQSDAYTRRVADINKLESEYEKLSDEALAGKTAEFKSRLAKGETLDDILPEAFAVCREAAARTLGSSPSEYNSSAAWFFIREESPR